MEIPLDPPRKSIKFKELMARLGLHILAQMIVTVIAGLAALKIDDWKSIVIFVLMVLGNGLAVITAFLDKASALPIEIEPTKPKDI